MIYAYCRVSTPHQRLERQITNITELYPKATIFREFYTGTTQNRPNWERLMGQIKKEDTIVFDSVSRMSRNAQEGFRDYKALYEQNVSLVFLNELCNVIHLAHRCIQFRIHDMQRDKRRFILMQPNMKFFFDDSQTVLP